MTGLTFAITGVEPAQDGLTPLLQFNLHIENNPPVQTVHALVLHSDVQLQPDRRSYTDSEKRRLTEVFGDPAYWPKVLRKRLWARADINVPGFKGETDATLTVPCSFDLNVEFSKYAYALQDGSLPLNFLFSGTVFFAGADGGLQVEQIPWDRECTCEMPVQEWHRMIERHYPDSGWVMLQREVFDDLLAYRRRAGLPTWDRTIEQLLAAETATKVTV